ncbi:hypothetical protein AVEN_94589-1 [Araneus ventricosus]|uniref:Uncharacterized protein n=1 Tax=Araneus ventricosus TaxID=182803 RepID=A0A4Y2ILY1_ARAVE|nr:hypothetical protein AVEN_94589-1 [Araneus ventricosus]
MIRHVCILLHVKLATYCIKSLPLYGADIGEGCQLRCRPLIYRSYHERPGAPNADGAVEERIGFLAYHLKVRQVEESRGYLGSSLLYDLIIFQLSRRYKDGNAWMIPLGISTKQDRGAACFAFILP